MRVSQYLEDSNSFVMKCPRCGKEETYTEEEIEEDGGVAYSASE